jgi:putative FmdB family regulatory protein
MPLYNYTCSECDKNFDIRHSYADKNIECVFCNSLNIKKNLSKVLRVTKKCYNNKEQVGSQVKKAIEEGKDKLKKYKKIQSGKVYGKK